MFQCFWSIMWTIHPKALFSHHYSPHLTAHSTSALDILAPAPPAAFGWQRLLCEARSKSQSGVRLYSVYSLSCFIVLPYLIVMHPGVSVSFVRSLVTNLNRDCSSVSGSPGYISWYSHHHPKAVLGHPAILHIPAGLTFSYIKAIHQEEGISVRWKFVQNGKVKYKMMYNMILYNAVILKVLHFPLFVIIQGHPHI